MKINRKGFTLVEIMIVVAIIALLAVIAVPNLIKARTSTQKSACNNNKRLIYDAIDQWALADNKDATADVKGNGDTNTLAIASYIKGGAMPTCKTGNKDYTLGGTVQGPWVLCTSSATDHNTGTVTNSGGLPMP
jgi:prepilin-type N-terminal cleavage/methylation domain-containing protein